MLAAVRCSRDVFARYVNPFHDSIGTFERAIEIRADGLVEFVDRGHNAPVKSAAERYYACGGEEVRGAQ